MHRSRAKYSIAQFVVFGSMKTAGRVSGIYENLYSVWYEIEGRRGWFSEDELSEISFPPTTYSSKSLSSSRG